MNQKVKSRIPEMISKRESDLLADWMREQLAATTLRGDLTKESELREQSRRFLDLMVRAASQQPNLDNINASAWDEARAFGLLALRDCDLHLLVEAAAICAAASGV